MYVFYHAESSSVEFVGSIYSSVNFGLDIDIKFWSMLIGLFDEHFETSKFTLNPVSINWKIKQFEHEALF